MLHPGSGLLQRLARDGYLSLRDACKRAFLEQLRDVADDRIEQVFAALGEREVGIGSAAGFHELVQRSPGRWDVPITLREFGVSSEQLPWWPLVSVVLGEDAEHSFSGIVFSEPDTPAQYWHIDSPHLSAEHLPPHALNVLVALQDIPIEQGPTEVARGSHALTNHLANPRLVSDQLVYQHEATTPASLVTDSSLEQPECRAEEMSAGSCLLFDDRLLHRGLGNSSRHRRYLAYFAYRKRGYTANTHFESRRSVFEGVA